MRPSYFLVCALLSPAVIGCSDSLPPEPVVTPPEPTAVHIKSGATPLLVAFRDGFDTTGKPVPWMMATPSTMVTFMAHSAYSVAVVCAINANTVLTWESLRVVADDVTDTVKEPTIQTPCNGAGAARRTVTGKMVQQGFAHLDDADAQSSSANWDVTLLVPDGTWDLVATSNLADPSTNKTLIRRNVAITGNQDLGTIDASTGSAQTALALALDNPPNPAKSSETVSATVDVTTKNNAGPALVSQATYDLKNKTIKLFGLPSAALISGDTQSVTFTGMDHPADTDITTKRSIMKPFKPGDDIATGKAGSALPSKIAVPGWGFDKNRLSVALPALPANDQVTIETSGVSSTDAAKTAEYQIDITSTYFQTTALARPVFDTDLPGFQAAWKIDFTKHYSRQITTQRDAFDDDGNLVDHETSQFSQDVNAP